MKKEELKIGLIVKFTTRHEARGMTFKIIKLKSPYNSQKVLLKRIDDDSKELWQAYENEIKEMGK